MKNTLFEISNKMKEFADANGGISEYVMDDYIKFVSSNHKYPLLWAVPTRMRVQQGQVQFIVNVAIMNILYDKDNIVKMLSDLADTVTQLFTFFDDNSQNDRYFIQQIIATEGTPFFIGVDNVVGWQQDLYFNVMFDSEQGRIMNK